MTEHGEDRIVIDACTPPGQYAVGRSDDHAVNPRTIEPRGWESDRLEPFGIRRALTERIACFQIGVPADLRQVSDGILGSTAHRSQLYLIPELPGYVAPAQGWLRWSSTQRRNPEDSDCRPLRRVEGVRDATRFTPSGNPLTPDCPHCIWGRNARIDLAQPVMA